MSTPNILDLPYEILVEVLSYVHDKHLRPLRSVHRSLAAVLGPRLFRRVIVPIHAFVLGKYSNGEEYSKVYDVHALATRDDVAVVRNSIRELKIKGWRFPDDAEYDRGALEPFLASLPLLEKVDVVVQMDDGDDDEYIELQAKEFKKMLEDFKRVLANTEVEVNMEFYGLYKYMEKPCRNERALLSVLPAENLTSLYLRGRFKSHKGRERRICRKVGRIVGTFPRLKTLTFSRGVPFWRMLAEIPDGSEPALEKLTINEKSFDVDDRTDYDLSDRVRLITKLPKLKEITVLRVCGRTGYQHYVPECWEELQTADVGLSAITTETISLPLLDYLSSPVVGRSLTSLSLEEFSGCCGSCPEELPFPADAAHLFWTQVIPNVANSLTKLSVMFIHDRTYLNDNTSAEDVGRCLEAISPWCLSREVLSKKTFSLPKLQKLKMFAIVGHRFENDGVKTFDNGATTEDIINALQSCPKLREAELFVFILDTHPLLSIMRPKSEPEQKKYLHYATTSFFEEVQSVQGPSHGIQPGAILSLSTFAPGDTVLAYSESNDTFVDEIKGANDLVMCLDGRWRRLDKNQKRKPRTFGMESPGRLEVWPHVEYQTLDAE